MTNHFKVFTILGSYHEEKYGDEAEHTGNEINVENQGHSEIVNEQASVAHDEEDDAVVTDAVLQPRPVFQTSLLPAFSEQGLEKVAIRVPVFIGNVNKGYLPPEHQTVLEKRSSDRRKNAFGAKNRQQSSKKGNNN